VQVFEECQALLPLSTLSEDRNECRRADGGKGLHAEEEEDLWCSGAERVRSVVPTASLHLLGEKASRTKFVVRRARDSGRDGTLVYGFGAAAAAAGAGAGAPGAPGRGVESGRPQTVFCQLNSEQ
jgi:hypothetical protein